MNAGSAGRIEQSILLAWLKKGAVMSSEKNEQAATPASSIVYSPLNEHERQINDDYEWCLHDPEVRRQYGNQVVAVHKRRIWGAGPNHSAALDAALQQPGCPPRYFLALPVVPPLVPSVADSSPPVE